MEDYEAQEQEFWRKLEEERDQPLGDAEAQRRGGGRPDGARQHRRRIRARAALQARRRRSRAGRSRSRSSSRRPRRKATSTRSRCRPTGRTTAR